MTRKATPQQARAAATAIVRRLRDAGHVAYFAGGCVRDELLGLAPTDYDVATDAIPDRIRSLFRRTAEVGAAFGVVLVTPGRDEGGADDATVEVATFRSDGPYTDRRRPDAVTFSTPQADAQRRDFTVNALYLDPLVPDGTGVIDFVGGAADLKQRVIRAVGDPEARLAEDHLRALRAVRFAARLGFEIDPPTAAAIRAHTRELKGVSRERIGEEMRRMFALPTRAAALGILEALGLDEPVLEEPTRVSGLRLVQGLEGQTGFAAGLAAWAIDRGLVVTGPAGGPGLASGLIRRYRKALCLSNTERDELLAILGTIGSVVRDWAGAGVAQRKRMAGGAGFQEAARLLRTLEPGMAARVDADVAALARTPSGVAPEPVVDGDDLVAAGLSPGPRFKRLLEVIYDAQLEDRVITKDDGIRLARELGENPGV
jgi:hypothetical protein